MIIAVSKLRSLCDRAISRLSHSSARSMYVTANANTLAAAHTHILDYTQRRAADPGHLDTFRGKARSMKSFYFFIFFNLITRHFWHMCCGSVTDQVSFVHVCLSAVPPHGCHYSTSLVYTSRAEQHRATKSHCQIDCPFKRIVAFTRFGLLQLSANRVPLY